VKIIIHGINFSPEKTGIGKYTGELAEWLSLKGHSVKVVTAPPYYPDWKIDTNFSNWWTKETETNFGKLVAVYRCPVWVPKKPSGLKRIIHLASFALSSFPVMLRQIFWRPDVVIVIEPPLFCAPQAWFVAKLSGAKSWLHVQDFEVDAAFNLKLIKGEFLKKLISIIEKFIMRRFDVVSTISHRMLDKLKQKGLYEQKTLFFPNWVDLNSFDSTTNKIKTGHKSYREILNIPSNAMVALYSGNMGGKQGLEIFGQVAKLIEENTNIHFVFCGNGPEKLNLEKVCSNLKNVRFLDLQPVERLSELLSMADIHLLPQREDVADLVMPSKLTGMLASGRPVVATASPSTDLANVLFSCGLVVPPGEPKAFADAILKLADDSNLRNKLGHSGKKYAETHFDRHTILSNFEDELIKLVN